MGDSSTPNSSDDHDDGLVANFDGEPAAMTSAREIPRTTSCSEEFPNIFQAMTSPTSNVCIKKVGSETSVTYNSCTFKYEDTPPPECPSANPDVTCLMEGKLLLFKSKPLHPEAQVYCGSQNFGTDTRKVAIKLIPSQEDRKKELELHKNLHHSNIAQLFACDSVPGTINFTYVVIELCDQNLEEYVTTNQNKPLDFETCYSYSKHILDGLSYLRQQNIIHRDLRPSNILLTDKSRTAKITDFKFARHSSSDDFVATTNRLWEGTSGYRAPELLKSNNLTGSVQADIFSYGLIVFYMFSKGKHPFGSNQYKWAANIIDDAPPDLAIISLLKQPLEKKRDLLDLLKICLRHKPTERWTAEQLQRHEFFSYATCSRHVSSSKDLLMSKQAASETLPESSQSGSAWSNLDLTSEQLRTAGSKRTLPKNGKTAQSPVSKKCRRDLKLEFSDDADEDISPSYLPAEC